MTPAPTLLSRYTGQPTAPYPHLSACGSEWQTLLDAGKTSAMVGTAGPAVMYALTTRIEERGHA